MIPFDPSQHGSLEWRQTGAWSRSYELRSGESSIGTLEFSSGFGSLAEARISGAAWSFKRTGFFHPKATARLLGSDQNLAEYEPGWSGHKGLITLAGGERLTLQITSFWGGGWALLTEAGQSLVRFQNRGIIRHGAGVDVDMDARHRHDLALLLTFGWYILVLHQLDSDAAAVVVAAG